MTIAEAKERKLDLRLFLNLVQIASKIEQDSNDIDSQLLFVAFCLASPDEIKLKHNTDVLATMLARVEELTPLEFGEIFSFFTERLLNYSTNSAPLMPSLPAVVPVKKGKKQTGE